MAKPVITDKPIIDQAEFNGVTIWRKEGGSIEVSDTNYPSMKAAIWDIASKAGITLQDGWNTQYAGWYLIQQLKNDNAANKDICNIPLIEDAEIVTINLSKDVRLKDYILGHSIDTSVIKELHLSGGVSSEDVEFIKAIAQSYEKLKVLDLSRWDAKEIPAAFFKSMCSVESIILPDSITIIQPEAFSECRQLKSIHLPNNLVIIADRTCVDGVFDTCENLESIVFPASLQKIGHGAFERCKKLSSITIQEGCKEIGSGAFFLNAISSIVLPSSIEKVGSSVFAKCKNLTRLELLSKTPPKIDLEYDITDCHDYLNSNLRIVVPKGTKPFYLLSDWGKMKHEIVETE